MKKTWAALSTMSCGEAGVFRDGLRRATRPDLISNMRVWRRWTAWEQELEPIGLIPPRERISPVE